MCVCVWLFMKWCVQTYVRVSVYGAVCALVLYFFCNVSLSVSQQWARTIQGVNQSAHAQHTRGSKSWNWRKSSITTAIWPADGGWRLPIHYAYPNDRLRYGFRTGAWSGRRTISFPTPKYAAILPTLIQAAARHWAAIRTELVDLRQVYSPPLLPKTRTIIKSNFMECRTWILPSLCLLTLPCTLITGIKHKEDVGGRSKENVHLLNTKNGWRDWRLEHKCYYRWVAFPVWFPFLSRTPFPAHSPLP